MLVMALEAVKQLADTKRQILAYVVKDVFFSKALVVPLEGEGKEVEVTARTSRKASQKDSRTWKFRLCARDTEE